MYAKLYLENIERAQENGNLVTGLCPFHEDSTPSFSAYVDTGVWACFGSCNLKGRDAVEFVARKRGLSLQQATEYLAAIVGTVPAASKRGRPRKEDEKPAPLVPDEEVDKRHQALINNTAILTELTNLRLWSLDTIKDLHIGWEASDDRIWIPVRGELGWTNVRRYDWRHKSDIKFLPYAGGAFGKPAIFPYAPEGASDILYLEGEPDTILARSLGFNAFCSTGGAGTPVRCTAAKATLLFDADEAGRKGIDKATAILKKSVGDLRVLELPAWEGMPANADFTDFIKMVPGAQEAIRDALLKLWAPEEESAPRVTLAEAIQDSNFGRLLRVAAVASGKNLSPFQVPKKGLVVCSQGLQCCKRCGLEGSGGRHEFEIKNDSPKLIECADEPSPKMRGILRDHFGIPKACTAHEIEVSSVQNLYDIRLTSLVELDKGNDKNPYIAIQAWCTQPIDLNTPFILTARAMPDPKNQAGTLLITKVESDKTSIDDFSLTDEQCAQLRQFQP